MSSLRIVTLILLVAVAASGCMARGAAPAGPGTAAAARGVSIVASFYPLFEFASRIGGEYAAVRTLVPVGAEPHDYEPTAQDVAGLMASAMFVYNGAGFEPWVEKLLPSLPAAVVKVNATAGLPLVTAESEVEQDRRPAVTGGGGLDPHVWLDPMLAQQQVDSILAGFVKVDPTHQTVYDTRAAALMADLRALDRRYRATLASCRRKVFITNHAAFGYLAERYGLTMLAISGLSPEAEPSPARLTQIVRLARRHDIRIIYFETLVSPRVAETIAREVGAQTQVLNPLEGLSPDDQRRGANYFGVMDENLRRLADGLDCR